MFAIRLDLNAFHAQPHVGAIGTATVYTSSSKVTHIIRKAILRMESWLYYLSPA